MENNIGVVDRYFRLASGLVLLGAAMTMRKRSVLAKGTLLGLGAMKVAEGATGFCPLIYLADTMAGTTTNSARGRGATTQSEYQQSQQFTNTANTASAANADGRTEHDGRSRDDASTSANREDGSRGDDRGMDRDRRHAASDSSRELDMRSGEGDDRRRDTYRQNHHETSGHRPEHSDSHRREQTDDSAPLH